MSRRIRVVLITALVAALVGAGALYAQGPGFRGRGPGGPGRPGAMLPLGQLELTDAQRQQIRQLAEQHRDAMRPLVERRQTAAAAERQAMEATPLDEGRIRAAAQELAQAQADLAVEQARLRSDVFGVLTPEQQQRAEQLRAEREARLKARQDRMRQRMQQRPRQPV